MAVCCRCRLIMHMVVGDLGSMDMIMDMVAIDHHGGVVIAGNGVTGRFVWAQPTPNSREAKNRCLNGSIFLIIIPLRSSKAIGLPNYDPCEVEKVPLFLEISLFLWCPKEGSGLSQFTQTSPPA